MDYIKLSGNNGSVPDHFFNQFHLTFQSDGFSTFTLESGRNPETKLLKNESKQIEPEKIKSLIDEAARLKIPTSTSIQVGGPEKIIKVKISNQIKIIDAHVEINAKANHFFHQCLALYDSDLENQLEEVL